MTTIRNIVIGGGGVAGVFAYPGVLKKLRSIISFDKIERIAGVSIGAITALMLALQFTDEEMENYIKSVDFTKVNDSSYLPTTKYYDLRTRYGYFKGDMLFNIIKGIFAAKGCDSEMTFMQLQERTGIGLFIIATHVYEVDDIPQSSAVDFSPQTTPDTPIAPTILASAAACPYFPRVRLKKISQAKYVFSTDDKDPAFVDGGFQNNFPIEIFDTPEFSHSDLLVNPETIGIILLTEAEKQQGTTQVSQIKEISDGQGLKVLYALLNESAMFRQTRLLANPNHRVRTIMVDRLGVNLADFDVSVDQQKKLRESGAHAVECFFGYNVKKAIAASSSSSSSSSSLDTIAIAKSLNGQQDNKLTPKNVSSTGASPPRTNSTSSSYDSYSSSSSELTFWFKPTRHISHSYDSDDDLNVSTKKDILQFEREPADTDCRCYIFR